MKENNAPFTVVADHIVMEYRVKTERPEDRRFGRYRKTTKTVLKDISFAAREKDFIGIIGRNGSGKSTLLRVLAGLETPTSGQVFASDKPQLLGVNAALMPTLTGNENVMLGLLAMGYTPAEAEEIRPRVIDLAQIGDAIYAPMKTYSSGMGARLRFAISVAAAPRILMVDEALATGDATFQERSKQAMNSMIKETGTVFLVNHSRSAIESMCNRVIWLEEGEIVSDGSPKLKMEQFAVFTYALSQGNREYAFRFLDKVREKYKKPR